MDLNSRTQELTKLKDENNQSLLKNKQLLEQLTAEIRAGEMRDVAISNRIDEVKSIMSSIDAEEET